MYLYGNMKLHTKGYVNIIIMLIPLLDFLSLNVFPFPILESILLEANISKRLKCTLGIKNFWIINRFNCIRICIKLFPRNNSIFSVGTVIFQVDVTRHATQPLGFVMYFVKYQTAFINIKWLRTHQLQILKPFTTFNQVLQSINKTTM